MNTSNRLKSFVDLEREILEENFIFSVHYQFVIEFDLFTGSKRKFSARSYPMCRLQHGNVHSLRAVLSHTKLYGFKLTRRSFNWFIRNKGEKEHPHSINSSGSRETCHFVTSEGRGEVEAGQ